MDVLTDLERLKHGTSELPIEDLILRRWSPRAFADKPVNETDLKKVFTAASWAASSFNEQPWRFLVGRKGEETWTKLLESLLPFNQSWAKAAPVLYAAIAKTTFSHNNNPNGAAVHDLGAACATLSLEATALGLHTHGMGGFNSDTLRNLFGIPNGFDPISCWALGYLGDPESLSDKYKEMELTPRSRNSLETFVFTAWEQAAEF